MIKNYKFKNKYDINDLLEIIYLLRTPGGCPWDIEQTHESIKKNFIEETYEVIEAINKNNSDMMREELGDVLMQILMHCQMEQEQGNFNFDDIVDELSQKLIIRHPHVFGTVDCKNSDEVLTNWDKIKMQTKGQKTVSESIGSIPRELPALMRAEKVQKKAAKAGFDWESAEGAFEKVYSECDELKEAVEEKTSDDVMEELGDLIFSCVNVSRFVKCDPEESLTKATDKFIIRFSIVEKLADERKINMKDASINELDELWDEAKLMSK